MNYKPLTVLDAAKDLPLKWYEAHPVVGSKILTFNIQVQDEETFNLVISGNTWPFRAELEKIGLSGYREEQHYYRVLRDVDCSSDEMKERVLTLTDIFHKQNVRVVIDKPKAELTGSVGSFINEDLSAVPQFHFAKWVQEAVLSN